MLASLLPYNILSTLTLLRDEIAKFYPAAIPYHIRLSRILVMSKNINLEIYEYRKTLAEQINQYIKDSYKNKSYKDLSFSDIQNLNQLDTITQFYFLTGLIENNVYIQLHYLTNNAKSEEKLKDIFSLFPDTESINQDINDFQRTIRYLLSINSLSQNKNHEDESSTDLKDQMIKEIPPKIYILFLIYNEMKKHDDFIEHLSHNYIKSQIEEIFNNKSILFQQSSMPEIMDNLQNIILSTLYFDKSIIRAISESICNCALMLDSKVAMSSRFFIPKLVTKKMLQMGFDEYTIVSIGSGSGSQETILLEALKNIPKNIRPRFKLVLIDTVYKPIDNNSRAVFYPSETYSLDKLITKYNNIFNLIDITAYKTLEEYEICVQNFSPTIYYAIDAVAVKESLNGMSEKFLKTEILNKSKNPNNICCLYTKKDLDAKLEEDYFSIEHFDMSSHCQNQTNSLITTPHKLSKP